MTDTFGCNACYGEAAETVWANYRTCLSEEAVLVDEPHLLISLRRCRDCAQPFVWIFTETVDWDAGNDRQRRLIVPLAASEAGALAEPDDEPDVRDLGALGEGRRYLVTDWPSDVAKTETFWGWGRFDVADGWLSGHDG